MFKLLTRLLILVVIIGVLLFFFAPRTFNSAANSLISSVDSSVAQAQGIAQFVPANTTTQGKSGSLQVNLNGLLASTPYDITLDRGQCGGVSKDLGHVTSDGSGNFYIELPLASLDTNTTWFVDVHQDNANGLSVACGQLQTDQNSNTQIINAVQPSTNVFEGTPTTSPNGLPNTGVNPGSDQPYQSTHSPRKY